MPFTADDYRRQLVALLPPGAALNRDPGTTLDGLLAAMADEMGRVDAAMAMLIEEADPRTALDLLPEWQRVAGLPDPCLPVAATSAEALASLVTRIRSQGGQNRAFFIGLALDMGHVITITESVPTIAGAMQAGEELGGPTVRYHWVVATDVNTSQSPQAGSMVAGDELGTWDTLGMQCVFARLKPAQTTVEFVYAP